MNTKKKPVSIVLLMASITTIIISLTGVVNSVEYDYADTSFSDGNIDVIDKNGSIDGSVTYHDYIYEAIEDPYEVGWD
jgi:hypothetical protein